MNPAAEAPANLAFGRFQVLPLRRELLADGRPIKLGARAFDVLMALIEARGAVIGKDTLMARVWPDRVVEENNLQAHISALRAAFGAERALIRTVSGRGYQFTGEIRFLAASPDERAGAGAVAPGAVLPPTNLPEPVSELIGRDDQLREILRLAGAHRLVTLTGAGGIGKTRLALAVAHRLLPEFADGVWLAEFSSLSNSALVPSTVAGVLGLGLGSNNILPESVARVIGDRKLLLVLDNCEHLIGAAADLAETLLALCPNITITVTSREILHIQGEHVYRVSPLDVPLVEHIESAAILKHSAAQLFIARAAELGADLSSDSQHPPTIAAICRHLDGIPLAIEFAAARTATLGIEEVAAGLRDRFELLTSGRRTALPQHRTLRATLDWSFELLTEAERELLRRLAIFAGPFSLAAACAVTGEAMSASTIAVGIADLVGKSLVVRTAEPSATQFRLLETTRAYALDRLNASGELDEVAHRHADYFLGILATVDELRQSQPADESLPMFRRYADEIHAALEWAFSRAGDPAIGVAMTIAAIPLWFELFQIVVARTRFEQALRCAEPSSDQEMQLRIAIGHALGTSAPRAPPSNRSSPVRWKLPSASALRLCGRRRSGGCGPHAAAAPIIRPLSKWRADLLMSPKVPATSAPCTLRTASSD